MMPNNKGVSNVQRRTWDKESYERIAKDRLERGEESQLDEAKRIAALKEKGVRVCGGVYICCFGLWGGVRFP